MCDRPNIDEINAKILRTLLSDARTSFTQIAKKCKVSSNTIRLRYNRLKKEGIIIGDMMQMNPRSFGYGCNAAIRVKTAVGREKQVKEFLRKIPGVTIVDSLVSVFNIDSIIGAKDIDSLSESLEKIKSNPDITNITIGIIIDVTVMDHPENLTLTPSEGY